ncbi:NEW3 domain-containing protein [Tepidanaerobacter acetatoxydans]|uniref:NEW3 domain-containing protein n=1 Tax=Tepidanaerobacter acetatoxydans TaxID=499229 RepID=UPI001BD67DAE|nr:NEW3 domain-containing protein [Tepidanaerobacter acetatoxydans]
MLKQLEFKGLSLWKVKKLALLFFISCLILCETAYAANALVLYTPYPGISAQPGSNITFPLTVMGSGFVDLEVSSVPSGWTAGIYGDGMRIHRVYVPSDDAAEAELRVKIPSDAKSGSYSLSVKASGAGTTANLPLSIRIDDDAGGADKIEVQYPSLSGPDTASFSFRGTLYNNSGRPRFYSLGADAPEGWQVSFKPAYQSNQITSLSLEAGKSQDLDIIVQPPKGVKAGKYTITAAAVYGSEVAKAELEVVISGTYRLELSTPSGRLNQDLTAGKKGALTLELENSGSANLQGINLSATAPSGWTVTFEPNTIEMLKSGEKKQVTAFITPSAKAIAGDYMITINATAAETSDSADIRTTIHTSTLWGLIGVVIIIGVVAWVVTTFRKYGRR